MVNLLKQITTSFRTRDMRYITICVICASKVDFADLVIIDSDS